MHVIYIKAGIEAANTVNIAYKGTAVYTARIAQIGFKAVTSTQFIKCCYGGNNLHG